MAMAQWHNLSVSRCPWCPAWSSASWTSATSWNLVEYNSSAFASSQLGGWPQKMCHLPTIGDIISTNPPRVQRCCKNPRYIYRARFDVFLSWFLLATPCVFPHYRAHFSSTPMKSKIGTSPKWGTWIGMGILMVYDGIWFLDLSIHFWVRYRDILSLHWDQLIHHRVTARRRRSSQSRYLCPGKNGGPRWEKHEQLGIRTWFLYIYIYIYISMIPWKNCLSFFCRMFCVSKIGAVVSLLSLGLTKAWCHSCWSVNWLVQLSTRACRVSTCFTAPFDVKNHAMKTHDFEVYPRDLHEKSWLKTLHEPHEPIMAQSVYPVNKEI